MGQSGHGRFGHQGQRTAAKAGPHQPRTVTARCLPGSRGQHVQFGDADLIQIAEALVRLAHHEAELPDITILQGRDAIQDAHTFADNMLGAPSHR